MKLFRNPFRPGAGQVPPYLAGREHEKDHFQGLLDQSPILQNLVLTGLRGVGKTVLLDELKPIATRSGWLWVGSDLSESASVSEASLAIRVLTDLSILTSSFKIAENEVMKIGYASSPQKSDVMLDYHLLSKLYNETPGLAADKLKYVLEVVWNVLKKHQVKGIVLSYDEAQILKDKAEDKQYPLSVLLEVIQYVQKKEIPYLLVLTGLPTLFPNLVEARTYAERMFRVITLNRLNADDTKDAIMYPIKKKGCPVTFNKTGIDQIVKYSSGYPYFIQFFCKEAFDLALQQMEFGINDPLVNIGDLVHKLDIDFYSGRWARITDKQRALLHLIAIIDPAEEEFTVKDITDASSEFKPTYISNLLNKLIDAGLIYKNRRGKYSFAVPLMGDFIKRQG
jgi:DNA-binding transcriptional ArsR family regulator